MFVPRVPKHDASIDESIDSMPPRRTVARVARMPPIKGPPGQFEDSSDEEKEEEDTVASLREELAALKAKFHNLEKRCAEGERSMIRSTSLGRASPPKSVVSQMQPGTLISTILPHNRHPVHLVILGAFSSHPSSL